DPALGKHAGRALIEHGLEGGVPGPVDQSPPDGGAAHRPSGEEPRKPATNDHYAAGRWILGHGSARPFTARLFTSSLVMVIKPKPGRHRPDEGMSSGRVSHACRTDDACPMRACMS